MYLFDIFVININDYILFYIINYYTHTSKNIKVYDVYFVDIIFYILRKILNN